MAWDHTYDVNTPTGSDDPKEGDDRIREIKAALQERLAKDHYFPKDGSEVSDTDAGEHKKVTLRVRDAPPKADDKGFLYAKNVSEKAELFYRDEDGNEIQLTSGGEILASKMYGAVGTTNISTSSETYVDMADMSITETFLAGDVFISFNASIRLVSTVTAYGYVAIVIDTVVKNIIVMTGSGATATMSGAITWKETLSAGEHTIKIQWKTLSDRTILQEASSVEAKRVLNIITNK